MKTFWAVGILCVIVIGQEIRLSSLRKRLRFDEGLILQIGTNVVEVSSNLADHLDQENLKASKFIQALKSQGLQMEFLISKPAPDQDLPNTPLPSWLRGR